MSLPPKTSKQDASAGGGVCWSEIAAIVVVALALGAASIALR